jgi:hypothetical protein
MILPSGITTLLCCALADHPALAFISVHVAPLSVDHHVSFRASISAPPINTILPSGVTTLLCCALGNHLALIVVGVNVTLLLENGATVCTGVTEPGFWEDIHPAETITQKTIRINVGRIRIFDLISVLIFNNKRYNMIGSIV